MSEERPSGRAWKMERAIVRSKSTRKARTNMYENSDEYYEGKVRKKTGKRSVHSRRAHKMKPVRTRSHLTKKGTVRKYPVSYRKFHTHSVDGTEYCHPVDRRHRTGVARATHKRAVGRKKKR